MYSKQQRQCRHGLLAAGQIVHGSEAFTGGHAVVVDPVQVRLLSVLGAQEGLRALVLGEGLQRKVKECKVGGCLQYMNHIWSQVET